jgi:aminoglycoside phosphotransferase
MTPEEVLSTLSAAGISADASSMRLESRKGRLAVHLGDLIAWFPETPEARAGIADERRILRLIERHCRVRAPRIVHEHADGWDVRAIVPGVDAPNFLELVRSDPSAARRLGHALGRALADLHTSIPVSELSGWLRRTPPWPAPEDIANIPKVTSDAALLTRIRRALEHRYALARELADPVLVHCDLGSWNLAADPATGALNGVFDLGDACLADRHSDFKYMQFHRPEEQAMMDAAVSAYEAETGVRLDRERIRFFNAIEAIGFLGSRYGHAADEKWCGRTLAEDKEWTDTALRSVGL